ncbi:MAG: NAD-dependent epimerase/dehydratase family protein [Rhodospirillales bacterium]|nr:NAD-dependent epimerase/dehydratase family protein [Alphaproteobacteria bacterium]MBL6948495.1 NAD-dependent epimerase/dehydratase family protein [Rhodospirillales bacterium]
MILLTGATGFVGSAVLRKLLERGHSVRALVRPSSDSSNLEGLSVDIAEGDLQAPETLKPALQGCTGLFHVAADYRLWAPDPRPMFQANVDGTRILLATAGDCGVERIVYTSSVAVLGILPGDGLADEETPVTFGDMIGPYKQSKFLAEQEVRKLVEDRGLPVVIVNPSTPIGPRDIKPTPTGRMIVEAASGRMPAYVDTGLNVAHVDDVAEGHLLAFEKGVIGERYVLGGQNMTLREILAAIADITGGKAPRMKIPHDLILPFAWLAEGWARMTGGREPFATVDGLKMAKKKMFFSHAKACRDLGYDPRPAKHALSDAVTWFREHGYIS